MKKIGARNIKTAVSVFICLILSLIFEREYSLIACITAVICTQNSVENSFVVSKGRILGTIFGGVIGYLFMITIGNHPLAITAGIIILIYFGNLINQKEAISMSCVTFLSILISLEDMGPLHYTINRVLESSVGIIVSIIVNKYLMLEKFKYFKDNSNV